MYNRITRVTVRARGRKGMYAVACTMSDGHDERTRTQVREGGLCTVRHDGQGMHGGVRVGVGQGQGQGSGFECGD